MKMMLMRGTTKDDVVTYLKVLGPLTVKELSMLIEDRSYVAIAATVKALFQRGTIKILPNKHVGTYGATYYVATNYIK